MNTYTNNLLGGKADGLKKLTVLASTDGAGLFKVPQFFVVTPDWQPTLASLRWLHGQIDLLGSPSADTDITFAVRSSALDEDGARQSFAGQLDSYLHVARHKISRRLIDVRLSGKSARVVQYRSLTGIKATEQVSKTAVIVQRMVNATVSGIAFSQDPTSTRGPVASLVSGLADKLVSGHCDGKTIWLDELDKTPTTLPHTNLIDKEQLQKLKAALLLVEKTWGCPVDIEFCFEDKELYLVQARPITTLNQDSLGTTCDIGIKPVSDNVEMIFDASNIQESYPGTTSPLTFSFARRAYSRVYQSFVKLLGVSQETIDSRSDIFDYMLAYHQNKIYYNMVSWHGVIRMLPFYQSNSVFMEQMMGIKEPLAKPVDTNSHTAGVASRTGAADSSKFGTGVGIGASLSQSFVSLLCMAKIFLAAIRLGPAIKDFQSRLDHTLDLDRSAISQMSLTELTALYLELESRLINRWDAPVTNDFFAMIAFGLLKKAIKASGIADCDLQLYLKGTSAVVSAEPPALLKQIAQLIAPDRDLVDAMGNRDVETSIRLLKSRPQAYRLYLDYLSRFGDRSLSELKLETPAVGDDPSVLLGTLAALAQRQQGISTGSPVSDSPSCNSDCKTNGKIDCKPDCKPDCKTDCNQKNSQSESSKSNLRQPFVIKMLASIVAKLLAQRENLRFARTRVFGVVRLIFNTMGKRLYEAGAIENERDIFYLSVDEILGFVRGTAITLDLRSLVALRREGTGDLARKDSIAAPCRVEVHGAYGLKQFTSPSFASVDAISAARFLKGAAASRGVCRGYARVIVDPARETLQQGEILVAERTDPGWIVHFALASALVTSYGNLLSHTAIVSRELGLPCVVAASGATEIIKDGDYIEVNGNTGEVTILKRAVEDLLEAA